MLNVAGAGCEGCRGFLCSVKVIARMLEVIRAGTVADDQAACCESLVVKANLYRLVRLCRDSAAAEL